MERRDYVEDQINQLGKLFAKILSMISAGNNASQFEETIVAINNSLKEFVGIDDLLHLDSDELINILKNNSNLNTNNLEKLAEILSSIAEKINLNDISKTKDFYNKSLIVYELINNQNLTYSFERDMKINKIKNILNEL